MASLAASPVVLAVAFAALALLVRGPFLVFTDLNWDEGLYRLIAGSLLRGHAPYLEIWDRKPVGVFVILAAAARLFGDSLATMRITTALSVAAGAWCLAGLSGALFEGAPVADARAGKTGAAAVRTGRRRAMGVLAGALFVLYSVRSGGEGTNTELFFVPLDLAGLWLLLRADPPADRPHPRASRWGRALAAGLLMGAALQVKYNAAFDIAAFGLMFLVLRLRGLAWPAWRRMLATALPATAGILIPTLLVIAWYALIGHLGDWRAANIAANEALVGTGAPPLALGGLPFLLRQYQLPIAGMAASLLIALPPLRGAATPARRRGLLALWLWLAGGVAALLFLRRFADHMLMQILPELCVGTGFTLVQAIDRLAAILVRAVDRLAAIPVRATDRLAAMPAGPRLRPALRAGLLLLAVGGIVAWEGRAPLRPAAAALEILARRRAGDIAWGDLSATVAAALRPRLSGDHGLYVFGGPVLGIYDAAGQLPPTRFAFVEHLWEGYAPVDGAAEMARILATRPAFIVVDDAWLPDADDGGPGPGARAAPVFERLAAALLRDYVRDGAPLPFRSGGGAILGARAGVTVFRRRDVAPFQVVPGLGYAAAG